MESPSNSKGGITKGQAFLEEWKKRRKLDEEKFLKQMNDLEYLKNIEQLRGKVVHNGKAI